MLKELITRQISAFPGECAVYLRRLDALEPEIAYNCLTAMPSASTIKVLIMAELMRQAASGEIDLQAELTIPENEKLPDSVIGVLSLNKMSVADLNTMMIILSDNTATNILIDYVGMAKVNLLAAQLGLTATRLERKMLDWAAVKQGKQNWTCAADLAELFTRIATGSLPESAIMMDTLFKQKHTQRFKKYLPESVKTATKPGSLDNLEHDAGVIYKNNVPWIWVVMTRNAPNLTASEFISTLTRDVYNLL